MAAAVHAYLRSWHVHRYANAQPVIDCPSQFADVAATTTPAYCPSRSIQLNGSAIPLFNSTTYYDKMLWAATWMYKVRTTLHVAPLHCTPTNEATTLPAYRPSKSIQINGGATPLFNSTTYYDKMLCAATWMYKVRSAS